MSGLFWRMENLSAIAMISVGERWRARFLGRAITVVVEWLSGDTALVRTVWD